MGQVVVHRAAGPGRRSWRAAARWLLLHDRVSICRAYADARITRIYGGTTEIMKEIIGKSLGI